MPTADAASSRSSEPFPIVQGGAYHDVKAVVRVQVRRRRRLAWHAGGGAAASAVVVAVAEAGFLPDPIGRYHVGSGSVDVVAGYWPVGCELDCRPLLQWFGAAGWDCALPVVVGAAAPLRFRRWRPGEPLVAGGGGIPEPASSAPEVSPSVVLVPLVAFDRAGRRLGQGAGHYDRTLAVLRARAPVLVVGLAFAVQEEPALPAAPHDQPLDWIVTEQGAHRVWPA